MITAANLGGFFAAHAIWSVSGGEMLIPILAYSSADGGRKILAWENCEDFDLEAAVQSFFEGVASHEKGAKIWNESLDESK